MLKNENSLDYTAIQTILKANRVMLNEYIFKYESVIEDVLSLTWILILSWKYNVRTLEIIRILYLFMERLC